MCLYSNILPKPVLTKKSRYFLIYFYSLLTKFVYGYLIKNRQIFLFVESLNLISLLIFLKGNTISSLNSLLDIAVIDHPTKGLYRFELNYVFWNYTFEFRIIIRLFVNGLYPVCSISSLYSSSDWLEREVWDMFGIKFLFHTNLRRILTDYGFKGHPLRKDFPLVGYVDLYYDDSVQAISISPLELSQNLRFYNFENPWNKWRY